MGRKPIDPGWMTLLGSYSKDVAEDFAEQLRDRGMTAEVVADGEHGFRVRYRQVPKPRHFGGKEAGRTRRVDELVGKAQVENEPADVLPGQLTVEGRVMPAPSSGRPL